MLSKYIALPDEPATLDLGARLAAVCPQRCVVFLQGNLGAGKTTLVRGFLRGLGYTGIVKSPTYTLVEPYEIADHKVFHFDLYRLNDPQELAEIGLRDYLADPSICLIEWPEQGGKWLPIADLTCYIRSLDSGRQLAMTANTPCGQQIVTKLSP